MTHYRKNDGENARMEITQTQYEQIADCFSYNGATFA
jgi:hypothetical protein